MPYTNIDATVTDTQRAAVFAAISQVETNLDFLINLTPQERQAFPKMGSATQSFVSKALEIAGNNPPQNPSLHFITTSLRICSSTSETHNLPVSVR